MACMEGQQASEDLAANQGPDAASILGLLDEIGGELHKLCDRQRMRLVKKGGAREELEGFVVC